MHDVAPRATTPAPYRRPPWSRLSGGHAAMLVAGVLGALLSLMALRGADQRVEVAVAAHELVAGSVVRPSDFSYARVAAPTSVLDGLIPAAEARRAAPQVASRPVPAGAVVRRADLRTRAAPRRLRAMSIPVPSAHAVDGVVAGGDRVDVILASGTEVAIVVAGVEVLGVGRPGAGAFGTSGEELTLTLAVDAHQSQLLAAAIASGEVFVARATGSTSAVGIPPLTLTEATGR